MSLSNRILLTTAPAASLFIRIMVGAVFLLVAGAGPRSLDRRWSSVRPAA